MRCRKLEKYQRPKEELEKIWKIKTKTISGVTKLEKWLQEIPGLEIIHPKERTIRNS